MAGGAKRLKVRFLLDVDNTLVLPDKSLNDELVKFLVALTASLKGVGIDLEVQLFTARSTLNSIDILYKLDATYLKDSPFLLTNLLKILKNRGLKLDETFPVVHPFDHIYGPGKAYEYHIKAFEQGVLEGSLEALKNLISRGNPDGIAHFQEYIEIFSLKAAIVFYQLIEANEDFDETVFINKLHEVFMIENSGASKEIIDVLLDELRALFSAWYFNNLSDYSLKYLGFLRGDKSPILIALQELYRDDLLIWIDDLLGLWERATANHSMQYIDGRALPILDIHRVAFIHQNNTSILTQTDYYREFLALLPPGFHYINELLNPVSVSPKFNLDITPISATPFAESAVSDHSISASGDSETATSDDNVSVYSDPADIQMTC